MTQNNPQVDLVAIDRRLIDSMPNISIRSRVNAMPSPSRFRQELGNCNQSLASDNPSYYQKLLLYNADFDGLLTLSDTLMDLHRRVQRGQNLAGLGLCGLLLESIRLASTECIDVNMFREVLDMLRQCSVEASGVRQTFARALIEDTFPKLVEVYEAVCTFLCVVVCTLEKKTIESRDTEAWKEIQEAHDGCTRSIQQVSQMTSLFAEFSSLSTRASSMRTWETSPAVSSSQMPFTTAPTTVHMLPAEDKLFYFRVEESKQLEKALATHYTTCVQGIGGVGKTSLALHVAHKLRSVYPYIFFLRSDKIMSMNQDFTRVAKLLQLPGADNDGHDQQDLENRGKVIEWLEKTSQKWLLIFDEADDDKFDGRYWPNCGQNGSILVTTRSELVGDLCESTLHLQLFSSTEGAQTFLKFAKDLNAHIRGPSNNNNSSAAVSAPGDSARASARASVTEVRMEEDADFEAARHINDEVGGLPLALKQLAHEARIRRQSVRKFSAFYVEDRHKYHTEQALHRRSRPHEKAVATNWIMPFGSLRKAETHGADGTRLLAILSLLEHTSIPQALFDHWTDPSVRGPRASDHLLPFCQDESEFIDVTTALLERNLINKDPDTEAMSLHKLIKVEFQMFLRDEERIQAFDHASKLLFDMFPKRYTGSRLDDKARSQYAKYIQHFITLNDHYLKPPKRVAPYVAPKEFVTLASYCSWYLFEIAEYPSLKRLLEGGIRACETLRATDGHSDATTSIYAFLKHISGTAGTTFADFYNAEVSLKEALEIRLSLPQPFYSDDDITMTINNLGILYNSLQQFDEAERQFTRAHELLVEARGKGTDDKDQRQSVKMFEHNLQRINIHSKKMTVTREQIQETIDFFEQCDGWFMQAHCTFVLGLFFIEKNDLPNAKAAFRRAEELLGQTGRLEKAPPRAMMLYKLAYATYLEGDYEEAEKIYKQSLGISKLHTSIPGEQARTQAMLAKCQRRMRSASRQKDANDNMEEVMKLLEQLQKTTGLFQDVDVEDEQSLNRLITGSYQ